MRRLTVNGYRLTLMALAAIVATPVANACPVCFGAPGDPLVKGANAGIWVLLVVVGFVQLGFVALFWTFWKRAKELRRKRDQFELIQGGAR